VSVIEEIKTLSPQEALRAMEALWAQLRQGDAEPESPEWHREELERRERLVNSGEAKFIPWEEAKARIRSRIR
jgi:putative addiction module component (TIGR02574 family)